MTNREIAAQLEISPATLSLIINNKPGISEQTRARVLRRMEELGLINLVKSRPIPQNSHNLCFVVYKRHGMILESSPFYLLVIESIEACAHKHGFNLLFLTIDRKNPLEEQISRLQAMDCKGVIVFATEMLEDDVALFDTLPFPYVLLDNDFPVANRDSVAINNKLGTFQAVEYLVANGHTSIGYLQSDTFISSFGEREEGFRQALKQFGLTLNPKFVFRLGYAEDVSYQGFRGILEHRPALPTAFFSDDDTIAYGAVRALIDAGYSVPKDVSVIGFNDRPAYAQVSPALSSIRVPKYSFGAMAIELLAMRVTDAEIRADRLNSIKCRIGTELIARESVQKLR